jgi:signal transduction histidine kinase
MNRGSLVGRLIWLAAGWSLALLIVTGAGLSYVFHRSALGEFDQGLSEDIDSLLAGSSVTPQGDLFAPAITDARAVHVYSGKYWQLSELRSDGLLHPVQDQRSRSLFDQEITSPKNAAALVAKAKGQLFYYETRGPLDQKLRVAVREATIAGYPKPVIFMVAQDRHHIDEDVRRFAFITAGALLVLGIGLVVAVVIQVRVGLAPLFYMGREISEVRVAKRSRLSDRFPAEIAPLAQELNALLDHNQEVVERQRTHVGNLAHALKTPISVMLAEAEAQDGPLADVVRRQAEAMQGHVEHHLRRARAAARLSTSGERTPVAEVVDELARMLERVFPDGEIEWDADDDLAFLGERQDLQEMAGNLMENACKWRARRVRVTAEPVSAQRLRLAVEDDGPGLPIEVREDALRRGQRMDETTPGSGLGLAIVAELAAAYGGKLTLGESRLGGLLIELDLPRAG